jgi:hypothetical protein
MNKNYLMQSIKKINAIAQAKFSGNQIWMTLPPLHIVELEELTQEEQCLRLHLEKKVEKAFYEAGKALMELRNRRLYRSTHRTFEEYCRDRFGYNRRYPYLLIEAAIVVDNLHEKWDPMDRILPTNERQVRPLTKLEPEQQRRAWYQAVAAAGGKVPSSRVVKEIVQQMIEDTKAPNPYRPGEVCQIIVKDNSELRGLGGCWGIVTQVDRFSCTVTTWNGQYTVKLEHLQSLGYSYAECEQMQKIYHRIVRVYKYSNLEGAADAILKHLGEIKRPYLTTLEEELLRVLENQYLPKQE